jgi:dihydropteroate synthase
MKWKTARSVLDLSMPKVMGIVNLTPDSFSDGGLHHGVSAALQHCQKLLRDGADILDIGAESTRPGANAVTEDEELRRLVPVLREAVTLGVPVSVDTYKPGVMQVALDLGADIINDVWALRWHEPAADALTATQVIARHPACGICLMHMNGEPSSMHLFAMQGDAVAQVRLFLHEAASELQRSGVEKIRIVVDPGVGFGKTAAQNFALLSRQKELLDAGFPLLLGWSRKSSLAACAGVASDSTMRADLDGRVVASVTAAVLAVERGASILRVHDVLETVQALRVLNAIR